MKESKEKKITFIDAIHYTAVQRKATAWIKFYFMQKRKLQGTKKKKKEKKR